MVDVGEELVCGSCGVVAEKQFQEAAPGRPLRVSDFTTRSLGAYMGPSEPEGPSGAARRLGSESNFRYLKVVSDFAGKEDTTVVHVLGMVERVCEKLNLPTIVAVQAAVIAKRLFKLKEEHTDVTSGALSAYSIIMACRINGVSSVGVREIVEAHRMLGRRVKTSALFEISFSSPVRSPARRAEEYVGRVLARLPYVHGFADSTMGSSVAEAAYFGGLRAGAWEALGLASDTSRGGHSPCALAATAVYAADVALAKSEGRRKRLTQRAVAETVGVAEYTVREQYGAVFRPLMGQLEELVANRRRPSP